MKIGVGEVASMLGISPSGVRYLESNGIVTPGREDESGYRYYSRDDCDKLLMYRLYKESGLGLEDVKAALEDSPEQVISLIQANIKRMRRDLEEIERHAQATVSMLEEAAADEGELVEFAADGEASSGVTARVRIADRPELRCVSTGPTRDLTEGDGRWWTKMMRETHVDEWVDRMPQRFFGVRFSRDSQGVYRGIRCAIARSDEAPFDAGELVPAREGCLQAIVTFSGDHPEEFPEDGPLGFWLDARGLKLTGEDAFMRFLHLQLQGDEMIYRGELWLPVAPKE